ncbi:general transcription factor II-I repeat domain-containing protein 2B-like [Sipha flava]|uniref:General transcription factor II-I repeat domain-containing protein 2B-like n=1 Tax=Sipha flava TaxID=143950 RepID=A0A8B8GBX9_9HEMI|nr:general transcription factor II-I repeat domain-containing protein 2B-like [Sipha flava]XP_025420227.1 general transcription factor II-I repeat domain-containing protein 2B-like [Sipha flava]
MSLSKKRKVDTECRVFNKKWNNDYFFIEQNNVALCVICKEKVAVLKEYNIGRHYKSKHASTYNDLSGKLRSDKFEILKQNLLAQQSIFIKRSCQNESLVKASFQVARTLAIAGKPFTDGQIVKECILKTVEEICPDKINLFTGISLSANTIARRTTDLGNDIIRQLKDISKSFKYFSIALDESTDASDSAQVLLFVRGVNESFEITEELAAVHSMKDSCTGNEIFLKVKESIFTLGLEFSILKGVTTDGGRNMCGAHTGLVGNICKAVFETGAAAPMAIHCIIHQQALCGKNAPISEVMNIVVQNVNYIRKSALSHRQFKNFLAEIESEYLDIPYHCEVRWLSRGHVLKKFFYLRSEIDTFMTEKNRVITELTDLTWLWKLAFLVDITQLLNELNLKLQGANSDFKSAEDRIRIFENPFALKIETLPTEFQLEVIELISNNNFKDYFKEASLQQFYAMLPEESFPNLKKHAREMISIFSSTYLCEQTFSKMKYVKSKYRTNLSDEHLQATLLIGTTKFDANFQDILKDKQFQTSH